MTALRWAAALVASALLLSAQAQDQKKAKTKEEKEEITQSLPVLPDPPPAVTVDTARLSFHVAPLSGKGLLSKQVEEGLKALQKQAKSGELVRVRAFVAGTGDVRRVSAIVSEVYAKRRKPLPVVQVIRIGLLPMNGAQVVLEGVSQGPKPVNPAGLAFVSGQVGREPLDGSSSRILVAGVAAKSVEGLKSALSAIRLTPADVLRVTCFATSLDDHDAVRGEVAAAFPSAALNIVQVQRAAGERMVECEGVARLKQPPADGVQIVNPTNAAFAQAALIQSSKTVFTGLQMAFGREDGDIRLAFTRLKNTLDATGSGLNQIVYVSAYPPSQSMLDRYRALRFEFLVRAKAPASTNLIFEGLPSLDATLGMDVIAIAK
jgi:enamine deaminase RidA (YjgF/YER057c/UK114 family)